MLYITVIQLIAIMQVFPSVTGLHASTQSQTSGNRVTSFFAQSVYTQAVRLYPTITETGNNYIYNMVQFDLIGCRKEVRYEQACELLHLCQRLYTH